MNIERFSVEDISGIGHDATLFRPTIEVSHSLTWTMCCLPTPRTVTKANRLDGLLMLVPQPTACSQAQIERARANSFPSYHWTTGCNPAQPLPPPKPLIWLCEHSPSGLTHPGSLPDLVTIPFFVGGGGPAIPGQRTPIC